MPEALVYIFATFNKQRAEIINHYHKFKKMNFFNNLFSSPTANVNLSEIVKQGGYLVDVREPVEFAGGSAKGAINIPLGTLLTRVAELKDKENIIVFCRSGNRSAQAKVLLQQNGIANVINAGGVDQVIQQLS